MLSDIQVIQTTGIPLYSLDAAEQQSIINAGFFAAIAGFANEVGKGKLQQIIFEQRQFLLRQLGNILFVFADDENRLLEYEDRIIKVTDNFMSNLANEGITTDESHLDLFERVLDAFDTDLKSLQLIDSGKEYNAHRNVSQIKKLIYISVGYTPGKCNIGHKEKMKRLTIGLLSLLISAVLFTIMVIYNIPNVYRLLLIIPNTFGALGILQYRANFCVYNGLTSQYVME